MSSQLGILRATSQVWSIGPGRLDRFNIQSAGAMCGWWSDEHGAHNLSERLSVHQGEDTTMYWKVDCSDLRSYLLG